MMKVKGNHFVTVQEEGNELEILMTIIHDQKNRQYLLVINELTSGLSITLDKNAITSAPYPFGEFVAQQFETSFLQVGIEKERSYMWGQRIADGIIFTDFFHIYYRQGKGVESK
jgi:hypothetical protein